MVQRLQKAVFLLVIMLFAGRVAAYGEVPKAMQSLFCDGGRGGYCAARPIDAYNTRVAADAPLYLMQRDDAGGYATMVGSATCLPEGAYTPGDAFVCFGRQVCFVAYTGILTSNCTGFTFVYVKYDVSYCPPNSTEENSAGTSRCVCNQNYLTPDGKSCKPYVDQIFDQPESCNMNAPFGNPIYPIDGSKRLSVPLDDWLQIGLSVKYDSRFNVATTDEQSAFLAQGEMRLGRAWGLNAFRYMNIKTLDQDTFLQIVADPGSIKTFVSKNDGAFHANSASRDRLIKLTDGWLHYDVDRSRIDRYSAAGLLLSSHSINGGSYSYTYSDERTRPLIAMRPGLPIALSDHFGRSLSFSHRRQGGQDLLETISFGSAQKIALSYNSKQMLETVNWPDGTRQEFLYEVPEIDWALTGAVGENGVRKATYGYSSAGRATSTELTGGVNRFVVMWDTPPAWDVTVDSSQSPGLARRTAKWRSPVGIDIETPNGQHVSIGAKNVQGFSGITTRSQPAGSGCAASTSGQDYDANGNIAWSEDFTGNRTCYANDLTRNLEAVRVEGLAPATACGTLVTSGAVLPAGSRKITTAWHPEWRYETQVATPRRKTTKVYNGQPDSLNGNTPASCAPATATLADGKPIVVLCALIEQATTDADGSKGLAAAVDSTVPSRIQKWTYNEHGQVLTSTDPNNNTTTYAYYGETTADYTKGDLKSVTNPKLHVTTYTKYNPAGQWVEMKDPNNVLTVRTFDARQRLKTIQTGTALTTYDYWPTGLLQKVTLTSSASMRSAARL